MDAALRHVAHALLVGVEEKQVMEHALQVRGGMNHVYLSWWQQRFFDCLVMAVVWGCKLCL
jgi:hypothetical protein